MTKAHQAPHTTTITRHPGQDGGRVLTTPLAAKPHKTTKGVAAAAVCVACLVWQGQAQQPSTEVATITSAQQLVDLFNASTMNYTSQNISLGQDIIFDAQTLAKLPLGGVGCRGKCH